jgi:dethiobiotin synthetase
MIRFITGTDTGVGKTVAAAVLGYLARADGASVRYVKPVQTGVPADAPGDAGFVAAAAGIEAGEIMRFDEPLAPAVAAERAGATIDFDSLTADVLSRESGCDQLFVEGAGGLLAPLAGNRTMADLATGLRAEAVVVARPGLGTLNHTALTVEAATRRGLDIAGLVISGWPSRPGLAERTNLDRLRALAPIIAILRRVRGVSVDEYRSDPLRRALERSAVVVNPTT